MDDQKKIGIFTALKLGYDEAQTMSQAQISKGTLRALLSEYESIERQIQELKTLEEISEEMDIPIDYLERVSHIINTDSEKLKDEIEGHGHNAIYDPDASLSPEIEQDPPEEPDNPDDPYQTPPEPPEEPMEAPTRKSGEKGEKGEKGKDGTTKNVDQRMTKSGEKEIADVLIRDGGEIARSLALERQEIGKWIMEYVGTVASQYGYTSYATFIEHLMNFWIENQGKITEMQEDIAQYLELIDQLKEALKADIANAAIMKALQSISHDWIMSGAPVDERSINILNAYKQVLITDPSILKKIIKEQSQSQNKTISNMNIAEME
jgi:transcriptional regulator with XRE-family HTH domain